MWCEGFILPAARRQAGGIAGERGSSVPRSPAAATGGLGYEPQHRQDLQIRSPPKVAVSMHLKKKKI